MPTWIINRPTPGFPTFNEERITADKISSTASGTTFYKGVETVCVVVHMTGMIIARVDATSAGQ